MNDKPKFTPPTEGGIMMDTAWVASLPGDTEGQRHAANSLDSIARTLTGLSTLDGWQLREEFCQRYGKVNAETKRAKCKGGVFKFGTESDFVKAGVRPPLIAPLLESADLVFKLRKLATFPAKERLTVDLTIVRGHHDEKYAGLPV